jgi:REP element-mobilizing transposase RayT
MSRTYTSLLNHVVFSTKGREPMLIPVLRERLFPYMGGIVRHLEGVALLINGVADHVHALVSLPATVTVAEFVSKLKSNSSRWIHETFPEHRQFAWQSGYAAFSVSVSQKQAVMDYIAGQEEHHRKVSFTEEVIAFLRKHEIQYDERYVFE